MKAFACQEEHEGTGGIYYADHAITAHKRFANEYNDGDLHGITCRRAPWADQYAPGPCPLLVMVDHGWWMERYHCGVRIDSDLEHIPHDPAEPVRELKPVEDASGIFCTADCQSAFHAERAERAIYGQWMLDLLRQCLRDKMPGCTEVSEGMCPHVYVEKKHGLWAIRQAVIAFTFPGCKIGPASIRMEHDQPGATVLVCSGDIEAWEAFHGIRRAA